VRGRPKAAPASGAIPKDPTAKPLPASDGSPWVRGRAQSRPSSSPTSSEQVAKPPASSEGSTWVGELQSRENVEKKSLTAPQHGQGEKVLSAVANNPIAPDLQSKSEISRQTGRSKLSSSLHGWANGKKNPEKPHTDRSSKTIATPKARPFNVRHTSPEVKNDWSKANSRPSKNESSESISRKILSGEEGIQQELFPTKLSKEHSSKSKKKSTSKRNRGQPIIPEPLFASLISSAATTERHGIQDSNSHKHQSIDNTIDDLAIPSEQINKKKSKSSASSIPKSGVDLFTLDRNKKDSKSPTEQTLRKEKNELLRGQTNKTIKANSELHPLAALYDDTFVTSKTIEHGVADELDETNSQNGLKAESGLELPPAAHVSEAKDAFTASVSTSDIPQQLDRISYLLPSNTDSTISPQSKIKTSHELSTHDAQTNPEEITILPETENNFAFTDNWGTEDLRINSLDTSSETKNIHARESLSDLLEQAASFPLPDYDPDVNQRLVSVGDSEKFSSISRATERAARILALMSSGEDDPYAIELQWLEEFFIKRPSAATFRAIESAAEDGLSFSTLCQMDQLREIWEERPEWWVCRVLRPRITNGFAPITRIANGPISLSWAAARRICEARSDFLPEEMIDPEWLDEWYALSRVHRAPISFPHYVEQRVVENRSWLLHEGLRMRNAYEDPSESVDRYGWQREVRDPAHGYPLSLEMIDPTERRQN
jgi:hypothetical protein